MAPILIKTPAISACPTVRSLIPTARSLIYRFLIGRSEITLSTTPMTRLLDASDVTGGDAAGDAAVDAGQPTRVIGGSASLIASVANEVSAAAASPMAMTVRNGFTSAAA